MASNHFYHYDGSGKVMQLSDRTQAVAARYDYDPWGVTQTNSGLYSSQPYRWSTKEQDAVTGLYYYGFRFYSPGLRTWINRDPIGEDGGLNLYASFANDPGNRWDEYGLFLPVIVIGGVAIAPEVAAAAVITSVVLVNSGKQLGKALSGVHFSNPWSKPKAATATATAAADALRRAVPDDATPEKFVPGSLKRSPSWAGELANETYGSLKSICGGPKGPRKDKAGKMKKLMEQAQRLLDKVSSGGRS